MLFLGLTLMGEAASKLRDMPEVADFLAVFARTPVLGILAGLAVTAVIQSSSSSVGSCSSWLHRASSGWTAQSLS